MQTHSRLALVTGASGAIGSAIARRLAASGAYVLAHYNSDEAGVRETIRAISGARGNAVALRANLADRSGPATLLEQIDGAFGGRFAGRLDILVNNAGTLDFGPLAEMSDEAFDTIFDVNVRAVFQLSREAARRMTKNSWGRIVNVGSVFGEAVPGPGLSLYAGSKFAVRGLTRGWSRDLGPLGITVNNVQPAVVQTQPVPTGGPAFDAMVRFTSVGRFGAPDEIASAVAFLASDDAAFINGESLTVDGGWSA